MARGGGSWWELVDVGRGMRDCYRAMRCHLHRGVTLLLEHEKLAAFSACILAKRDKYQLFMR